MPENASQLVSGDDKSNRRGLWRTALDVIFGYDLFISYAWTDGETYATALANRLKKERFEVFLDRERFRAGDDFTIAARWALRRTGQLILVATKIAEGRKAVIDEIEIFQKTERDIIPIDFDGSLTFGRFEELFNANILTIREPANALLHGPSEETIARIKKTFNLVRQEQKRIRIFAGAAALFLVVAIIAVWQAFQATAARDEALLRQSRLLADKAESLAASGDGTTALLVAMEAAIDSKSGQLRSTPEAFAALHSGLYSRHEVAILVTDTAPLVAIAHSTNDLFAVGSSDGSVYVFDRSGPVPNFPIKHGARIRSLMFSPDGGRLLSVSDNSGAQQWDISTGKPFGKLMAHEKPLYRAKYDHEGKNIITVGEDSFVKLWKPEGAVLVLRGHLKSVNDASFSSDGRLIVTCSDDMTARIWNAADGKPIDELRGGHIGRIVYAGFDPANRRVVTTSWDHSAVIWNFETGRAQVLRAHGDRVYGASFSPDGERLLTFSEDATARLWDVRQAGVVIERLRHEDWVLSAQFSRDGREIVTTSRDSKVRVWDGLNGSRKSEFLAARSREKQLIAALDNAGNHIVTVSSDGTARIWQAAAGAEIAVLRPHDMQVLTAAFNSSGSLIATGDQSGMVRLWDTERMTEVSQRKFSTRDVWSVAFSPKGDDLLIGSHAGVHLWREPLSPHAAPKVISVPSVIRSANFSHDGRKIVAGGYSGFAYVWSADEIDPKLLRVSPTHQDWIHSTRFGTGDDEVLMASRKGNIRIWRWLENKEYEGINLPKEEGRFEASQRVFSAHFSRNNKRLVSAHEDGRVWVWEKVGATFTGKHLTEIKKPVWQASFSPDDSMILVASFDGFARVYDSARSWPLAVLAGHTREVRSASFNKEGTRIVTTSNDGTARVWPIFRSPEELVEHVASGVPRCLTLSERLELGLDPSLPKWCIAGFGRQRECDPKKMKPKWPYRSDSISSAC